MASRIAVIGFQTVSLREALLSAIAKHGGKIVYWNVRDAEFVERCHSLFPEMSAGLDTESLEARFSDRVPLSVAAEQSNEVASELWPSFYKSWHKFGIDGGGLDAQAVFYAKIGTAIAFLDQTNPDTVLFGNNPTGFIGYAVYLIAKKRGLRVRVLRRVLIPGIDFLSLISDTLDSSTAIEGLYRQALRDDAHRQPVALPEKLADHVAKLRGAKRFEDATPDYFRRKVNFDQRSNRIKPRFHIHKAVFHSLWKKRHKTSLGGLDTLSTLYRRYCLFRTYQRLTTDVSLDVPYIYIPLHYQPEASTVPNGGRFGQQHFMIDLVSKLAPQGWQVFVKEHPSQLLHYYPNRLFRSGRFYKELLRYPNVRLLPITGPTNVELIRNAKCVATVTGYSGWEAINWGIPAVIFGAVWYGACDGVYRARDARTLGDALSAIERGEKPDFGKIDYYLKVLWDNAVFGRHRNKAVGTDDEIETLSERFLTMLGPDQGDLVGKSKPTAA